MQKKYLHRHNPDALVRALQRKKTGAGLHRDLRHNPAREFLNFPSSGIISQPPS